MYSQAVLLLRKLQGSEICSMQKNSWKFFEQIVTVACFHVILFTMHEKHIAREVYLEHPQRYMMTFSIGQFWEKKLYHRCSKYT